MLHILLCLSFNIFFFKQKTAYEMRISDWSSDVCSSDLQIAFVDRGPQFAGPRAPVEAVGVAQALRERALPTRGKVMFPDHCPALFGQIGRASCRESVCQYV